MKQIAVKVQPDHLNSLMRVGKPIAAIEELLWNAFDADATTVRVDFQRDALDGIIEVIVKDDGHGIAYDHAVTCFENLGGSKKGQQRISKSKRRQLHGKAGKGRFRAFALGNEVTWKSTYIENGKAESIEIRGTASKPGVFELDDPIDTVNGGTGTTVIIGEIAKPLGTLLKQETINDLTEHFAIYVKNYSDVAIWYNGKRIDPSSLEKFTTNYPMESVHLDEGLTVSAVLSVIEWNTSIERMLNLCNAGGFTLRQVPPGVQAPGFHYTAYLKSDYFEKLENEGALQLEDMHPHVQTLIDQAKVILKEHFRKRSAESVTNLVSEWKRDQIYPYEGEPISILERTERQVFDVCAASVSNFLPEFENTPSKSKKFTFTLLKEALKDSPETLAKIFNDVLGLPAEKQKELARLLEKTTLSAIINSSKLVADRLDFLRGLEILVFDASSKKQLLERKQLHRIIAEQTWIFGEEYNLTVDDQSLTEVLRKHESILGRESTVVEPVVRHDGSEGIIDLMLSRRIPLPNPENYEHLVVELKRPSVKVDMKVRTQIESYALAVAADERFKSTNTKWNFWAVSNEVDSSVAKVASQRNRPEGLLYEDDEGKIFVWVKTWGQLINSCKARLEFFKKELDYTADSDSARSYLQELYLKYLPEALKT